MPTVPVQSYMRITHTGIMADGVTPNQSPILIPDLDVGYENQHRKSPVYVPVGGYLDSPLTSKVLFSAMQGALGQFQRHGMVEISVFSYSRDTANLGGTGGTGITLAAAINNVRRTGGSLQLVINSGLDTSGFIVGERTTITGLGGAFASLNGTYLISSFTKGQDFAGANPAVAILGMPSAGADILPVLHGPGVLLVLPDGMVTHLYSSAGNAGGLGPEVRTYIAGDMVLTGTLDPIKIVFSPTSLGAGDKNVLAVDAGTGALVFYDSTGSPAPVGTTAVADLTDGPGAPAPASALKIVRVNAAGDALEYVVLPAGAVAVGDLTDGPGAPVLGEALKLVRVNAAGNAWEYTAPPSPTVAVGDLTDGPGAPALGEALKFVRVNAAGNAWEYMVPAASPTRDEVSLVASTVTVDFTQGTIAIGQTTIDPSSWTGAVFTFQVRYTLLCSGAGITTQALLYNVTDGEVVTGSTLVHTGDLSYTTVTSAALTIGAAAGNLKNSAKVYEVRLSVSAGGATAADVATLTQASLLVVGV